MLSLLNILYLVLQQVTDFKISVDPIYELYPASDGVFLADGLYDPNLRRTHMTLYLHQKYLLQKTKKLKCIEAIVSKKHCAVSFAHVGSSRIELTSNL